jgi:hypothetical protein
MLLVATVRRGCRSSHAVAMSTVETSCSLDNRPSGIDRVIGSRRRTVMITRATSSLLCGFVIMCDGDKVFV